MVAFNVKETSQHIRIDPSDRRYLTFKMGLPHWASGLICRFVVP